MLHQLLQVVEAACRRRCRRSRGVRLVRGRHVHGCRGR